MMTSNDSFINSLEDKKGQMQVQADQNTLSNLTDQEEISRNIYKTMRTTVQNGLDAVQQDQQYKMKMQVMNYANQIRDQINYGDLDFTNSAIRTAYINNIQTKFAQFKTELGVFNDADTSNFLTSTMQNSLNSLNEVASKQFHQQRLDMSSEYLNFDTHRHDDYENVLDSKMGQEAYHTLVAQWGEARTHQYINEQRNKNVQQMIGDSNVSEDLLYKYLTTKMDLPASVAQEYVNEKIKMRIQASTVTTLDTNEIAKTNPQAAALVSQFNLMLDKSPQSKIDAITDTMNANIKSDSSLSSTDKAIRENIINSYAALSKEQMKGNVLDYFVERGLASPGGFTTHFPNNKAASRLDLADKTALYDPNHSFTLFTTQEATRLKNGDVTIIPFVKDLEREIKLSPSPYAKKYEAALDDVLLNKTSPVIYASVHGLNTPEDLEKFTNNLIKNPALSPVTVLDKFVDEDSTLPFTQKRMYTNMYKNDPAFKAVLQNEFAKTYANGQPPQSVSLDQLVKSAGIQVDSPDHWSIAKTPTDYSALKDKLIGGALAYDPNRDTLATVVSKYEGKKFPTATNPQSHPLTSLNLHALTHVKAIGVNKYGLFYDLFDTPVKNIYTNEPVTFSTQ